MSESAIANGRDIREIVVGVDGSAPSDAAVRWAAREALLRALPLKLVHVVAAPVVTQTLTPVTMTVEGSDELARRIIGDAADLARHVVRHSGAPATAIASEIYYSAAVPTLIELSGHAEMVVVGTQGHRTFHRGLAASVSNALVHHAHCPVAVIHDIGAEAADAPVVVGINCSPQSAAPLATHLAYREAAQRRVGLIAVHAWSDSNLFVVPGVDWSALREDYPDVRVRRVIVPEQSARCLTQVAESAQLLVVGSDGRGGVTARLGGSLTTTLAHSVRIPIIFARQTSPGPNSHHRSDKPPRSQWLSPLLP